MQADWEADGNGEKIGALGLFYVNILADVMAIHSRITY